MACLKSSIRDKGNHASPEVLSICGSSAQMPIYIDTKANHLVDDLSRENLDSFLSKGLDANHFLTLVPQTLMDPLLDSEADWVLPIGGISSAVFSEWFSPSDTENLHGNDERIPFFSAQRTK